MNGVRPWAAAWVASSIPFTIAYGVAGEPLYWGVVPGAFCVLGVLAHRYVSRWQDRRGFDEQLAAHWLTTHRDESPYWMATPDVQLPPGTVTRARIDDEPDGTARMNADIRADERRRDDERTDR